MHPVFVTPEEAKLAVAAYALFSDFYAKLGETLRARAHLLQHLVTPSAWLTIKTTFLANGFPVPTLTYSKDENGPFPVYRRSRLRLTSVHIGMITQATLDAIFPHDSGSQYSTNEPRGPARSFKSEARARKALSLFAIAEGIFNLLPWKPHIDDHGCKPRYNQPPDTNGPPQSMEDYMALLRKRMDAFRALGRTPFEAITSAIEAVNRQNPGADMLASRYSQQSHRAVKGEAVSELSIFDTMIASRVSEISIIQLSVVFWAFIPTTRRSLSGVYH